MTDNIFEFSQTNQALGSLSETIIKIDTALKNRQAQAQNQEALLQQKEQEIAALRAASDNALQNIDDILKSIDNVLENNGTSNHNN